LPTSGVSIKVKGTGRIQVPKLDNGQMTAIGNAMVTEQKRRWAFAVNSDGIAAKKLSVKYSFEKAKYRGTRNPIRDMKMTGRTIENFQLRKAMDNTIRAENTTRLERAKATRAQMYDDMIGFAPTDQMVVFRAANAAYGEYCKKAWVQIR
jgi:hypothetical protein